MERTVRTQPSLPNQEEMEKNGGSEKYEEKREVSGEPTVNSKSLDEASSPNTTTNNNVLHRSRSQSKVKLLVRSHAVREETSPPREAESSPRPDSPQQHSHKLRRDGSQGASTESYTLSRGNSREQYDGGSGVDLQQFIVETLNRNHKDRMLLLKIEYELLNLAKDSKRTAHKFGQMSSYQRMLVHRVAAYFGMEHNVDPTGASVIVNTTKATRLPETRFRDFVREDVLLAEEPRRSILKRDSSSFDETGCFKSGDGMLGGESRRSKSFEEREEEYQIARRRIFNREHCGEGGEGECMEELHWESESICPQCDHTNRLQPHQHQVSGRLVKVESYESGDALRSNSLRLSVSKSHSFNGYEPPHHNTRILTKQDSGSSMSSRISPSSSGYKSQRSDATLSATPSPTATPNLHAQLSSQSGGLSPDGGAVVWAVTDLASVPPGSVLIHPQTGQPYTNADGSIYHFDPGNPPRVLKEEGEALESEVASRNSSQEKQSVTVPHYQPPQHATNPTHHAHDPTHHAHDPRINNRGVYSGGYGGGYPGGGQYNVVVPQQGSLEALPHPIYLPQQYDPRIHESSGGGDLASYMMGLSIDGARTLPDNRPPLYWPSHHIQATPGGGGVYYGGARYPPPFPPHQTNPHDHAGGCYGGGYGGDCIPYTGTTSALHMYYPTTPTNNGQTGGGGGQGGGYYSAGVAPSPIVALQYQQPCPHPTPPHTPQGVCNQVGGVQYNGCYPTHYPAPPNPPIPVAQFFRKPTPLQVGVGCERGGGGGYTGGGYTGPGAAMKEREEKQAHLQHPTATATLPLYGIRVIPGEMRLVGSAPRLPFPVTPPKPNHNRKHRCSKSVLSGSRVGGHQAQLSAPLQLSNLHAPQGKA